MMLLYKTKFANFVLPASYRHDNWAVYTTERLNASLWKNYKRFNYSKTTPYKNQINPVVDALCSFMEFFHNYYLSNKLPLYVINLLIRQLRPFCICLHIATFRLLGQEFRLELVLKQHKKVHPKLICNLLPVGTMKAL